MTSALFLGTRITCFQARALGIALVRSAFANRPHRPTGAEMTTEAPLPQRELAHEAPLRFNRLARAR